MKRRRLRRWVKVTLLSSSMFVCGFASGKISTVRSQAQVITPEIPVEEEVSFQLTPEPVVEEPVEEVVPETVTSIMRRSTEDVDEKVEEVAEEDIEINESDPNITSTLYGDFTEDELNLIYAVVRQEGGPEFVSAQAVMSTVINRLNSDRWRYCGSTVLEQIKYPNQFCYSLDNYWQRYLGGNVEDSVKEAVLEVLNGNTNHNYTSFRGNYVEGSEQIGSNWFF